MEIQERRLNMRVATEFKVSYVHHGDYLISYTKDVSVDGMFLFTESPLGVGEKPRLTFTLHGKELSVIAEVIWVNRPESSKDAGMGVRFIDPPEPLKKEILKLINKVAIFYGHD